MDKLAVEAYLHTVDFGDDNYLLDSSSSSESEYECSCPPKPKKQKIVKKDYMEIIPQLLESDFKQNFKVNRKTVEKITEFLTQSSFLITDVNREKRLTNAVHVFLWYLGNKEPVSQIAERFSASVSWVQKVIRTGAIELSAAMSDFICWPSAEECSQISDLYNSASRIKGAIGTLGVSHFEIPKPKKVPEGYLTKQGYYTLAVQGTVTVNHKFIDIMFAKGGSSYVDILNNSNIPAKANKGMFGDCFLVCDNSYPVLPWLIPPYSLSGNLDESLLHFNECHQVIWSVLPQAFGFLIGRFERLQDLTGCDVVWLKKVIASACIIHNLCVDLNDTNDFFVEDKGIFMDRHRKVGGDDNAKRKELLRQCLMSN